MGLNNIIFITTILILNSLNCKSIIEAKPLNVVIFYADDLGWTDLGVKSDYYETPVLDQLAKESMVFNQAYANAANCAPSRACLMTGMYPPRNGIYTVASAARGSSANRKLIPVDNKVTLDPGLKTLPQYFKDAGYTTCVAGKWHLSEDPIPYGFDHNIGGNHLGHPKSYFSPYKNPKLTDGPKGEHLPARLAKDVNTWISDHSEQPFLLYFPFYSVHTPIQARQDLVAKYSDKSPGINHKNPKYAAMIEAMDQAIGSVLQHLSNLKLTDNTIIIFSSDNGPHGGVSLAKPLRGVKGMYYEGGIREPLFIKWPGVTKGGSQCEVPVIGSDILPTLLELIPDVIMEKPVDGVSLLPLLKGDQIADRTLFWHFPAYLEMNKRNMALKDAYKSTIWRTTPCSVIRWNEWKLIEYFETGELELYNLDTDLSEQNNLADQEPERKRQMLTKLRKMQQDTKAFIPSQLNPEFKS